MHFYIFVLIVMSALVVAKRPEIDAPCGRIQGKILRHADGRVSENYLGIPYAEPPVGDRRFRSPVRMSKWDGSLDAGDYGSSCFQDPSVWRSLVGDWLYEKYVQDLDYSEDCLSLNIFTPEGAADREPLPVMVWIYGGAWQSGASAFQLYSGDFLALMGDVIVVSINYRLGPFGFLTTGNDVIPGNAGLFDQKMALEWVRDNIASFGGDPESVTLFGESTGAASLAFHTLSPLAAGLFHRAIGQSGSAFRLTATPAGVAANTTYNLISAVGCVGGAGLEQRVQCLRGVSPEALLLAAGSAGRITPVIDGDYIPDNPDNLWKSGQFNKVDFILGTNANEASLFISDQGYYDEGISAIESTIFAQIAASITGYPNQELVQFAILTEHFTGDLEDPFSNLAGGLRMFRGLFYEAPKSLMLKSLVTHGCRAFEYRFSPRPTYYPSYKYDAGAWHADEMAFMFGALSDGGVLAGNATADELELSSSMMNAWVTFAKTGTPVYITNDQTEAIWPEFDLQEKYFLDFDLEMSRDSEKTRLHEVDDIFWNEYLPSVGNHETKAGSS